MTTSTLSRIEEQLTLGIEVHPSGDPARKPEASEARGSGSRGRPGRARSERPVGTEAAGKVAGDASSAGQTAGKTAGKGSGRGNTGTKRGRPRKGAKTAPNALFCHVELAKYPSWVKTHVLHPADYQPKAF